MTLPYSDCYSCLEHWPWYLFMPQKFPSHPISPSENILFSVKDSHIHCDPHMPQPQKEYVTFSLESHFIIYVSNFRSASPTPWPFFPFQTGRTFFSVCLGLGTWTSIEQTLSINSCWTSEWWFYAHSDLFGLSTMVQNSLLRNPEVNISQHPE